MSFQNLRDWAKGDPVKAVDLQAMTDRHNAVYPLSFSGNVQVRGSSLHGMHVYVPFPPPAPAPAMNFAKVVEVPDHVPNVVLVRFASGPATFPSSGDLAPIRAYGLPTVNDTFPVLRTPFAMLTYTPEGDGATAQNVIWHEVRTRAGYQLKITAMTTGAATCTAKRINGGGTTGPDITVSLIYVHATGDTITVTDHGDGLWFEVKLPTGQAEFAVLQSTGAVFEADMVKGHNT